MNRRILIGATALAAAAAVPGPARAQAFADRIGRVPAGAVRFAFTARPGVCGDGQRDISVRGDDGTACPCAGGPVRVTLRLAAGAVTGLEVRVGPPRDTAGAADLGTVPAPEAAHWLLALAARTPRGDVGDRAVFAAALADSVSIWPDLLRIARDGARPARVRRSAVFWVGQAAADAATRGLDSLVRDGGTDREVKNAAIFAISRQRNDVAVPTLMDLARSNRDPEVRRQAMFWLGQSGDPRALAFFEKVLTED